jgi:DNA-binding NtrC family response regulator
MDRGQRTDGGTTTRELAAPAARARAVVALRRWRAGDVLALPPTARITVGAGPACDVVVEDRYASRLHCAIERRGERTYVRDRGSRNGTFVNGHRVEVAELTPGNLLSIGHTAYVALGAGGRGRPGALEALRGRAPALLAAIARAVRAASSTASVLVLGETGTGKELIARAVHEASPRAGGPFVAVNCGAIPAELIGAELFGHERGAFTGADRARDGCFVQADGGTLFLDELGELPAAQQPHLLRVLETRAVRRLGGDAERPVDFRLVAATNRLALGAPDAPLRADLYHRVATIPIHLPPLRERLDDLPLLIEGFLAELAPELGGRRIAPATLAALARHPWPGNVRELRQAVHRAAALSLDELRLDDLVPGAVAAAAPPAVPAAAPDDAWAAAQRAVLADALARHGTARAAARALGIPRSTFADRARRLGLTP